MCIRDSSVEVQDAVFTARIPIETKRIYELNVGDRVVDNGWTWEFRTGNNYTGVGEVKPLVWVVAAKDQYVDVYKRQAFIPGRAPGVFGRQFYIVMSGSMSPAFDTGSLIFVRPADPETIRPGDIITLSLIHI